MADFCTNHNSMGAVGHNSWAENAIPKYITESKDEIPEGLIEHSKDQWVKSNWGKSCNGVDMRGCNFCESIGWPNALAKDEKGNDIPGTAFDKNNVEDMAKSIWHTIHTNCAYDTDGFKLQPDKFNEYIKDDLDNPDYLKQVC